MVGNCNKQNTKKKNKPRKIFSSLGLVIPFQPSMWDDKTILAELIYTMKMVSKAIREKYTADCADKILHRLEKIFTQLNFDTLRKTVVIILEPDNEKIIYLSFVAKPMLFFGKSVSLLNLAGNIPREADFYFLVFDEGDIRMYEYCNRQLGKVYEHKQEMPNSYTNYGVGLYDILFRQVQLVNYGYKKPVFVTGKNEQMDMFLSKSPFAEITFKKINPITKYPIEIIKLMAQEINYQWRPLRTKFIAGRIKLAIKTNSLIGSIAEVLAALRKNWDGLLLLDKRLKKQLQKKELPVTVFDGVDELMYQIEQFLMRGNVLEITETGLLKDFGGIVFLIKKNIRLEEAFFYRHNEAGGSLY
jgi:hypothetical protein